MEANREPEANHILRSLSRTASYWVERLLISNLNNHCVIRLSQARGPRDVSCRSQQTVGKQLG